MLFLLVTAALAWNPSSVEMPGIEPHVAAVLRVVKSARRMLSLTSHCDKTDATECANVVDGNNTPLCKWVTSGTTPTCKALFPMPTCTDSEVASGSASSWTCSGDYVIQKSWSAADQTCSAEPSQKTNLHKGRCSNIFGLADNYKWDCDGADLVLSDCAQGEEVFGIWGIISSFEYKLDSTCTADDEGDPIWTKDTCEGGKLRIKQYSAAGCANSALQASMLYVNGCYTYKVDQTTNLNMAVTCSSSSRIITLCSSAAKTITMNPDSDSPWLALAEVKMKLPGSNDCQAEDGKWQKFACGGGKITLTKYDDSACTVNPTEHILDLGVLKVQQFPPPPDPEGTKMVARFECQNGWFEMYPFSVFVASTSSLKRTTTTYTYVKPDDLTNDGNTIKHNGAVVTPESNKNLQPVLQYANDPAYANKETSAASSMFVAFGILASLFAL